MALKDPNPIRPKTSSALPTPQAIHISAVQTVVLLLTRFQRQAIAWGVSRLVKAALYQPKESGLLFQKVLGSGHDGGFGLRPGLDHQGVFSVFDSSEHALRYLATSAQTEAYKERAEEFFAAVLMPLSCRGHWSGFSLTAGLTPAHDSKPGPVASLTRASIRPHKARAFWAQSPDAEADLAAAKGCLLSVGLGEAPLLRQATFSLWQSPTDMDLYARSGAHQRAIRAAYGEHFFSESMFVRFMPLGLYGQWKGQRFAPFDEVLRSAYPSGNLP